ncbi:MAG: SRPBCC family protein [Gammaproteobacteria bacterium]|nr:SRPBCC family protein [Gammaproteobacteria bacterium]MCP5426140.1 SRPBCC family protein [Gammaproteobacteria bacterium]
MTHIVSSIVLPQSPEQVFDFVTAPAHWPRWHPASLTVDASDTRSFGIGEQVCENVAVGGYRGRVLWTVRECQRPSRWLITGQAERGGGRATLRYDLVAEGSGARFTRTLDYRMPNLFMGLMDGLFIKRRMVKQSNQALERLRDVLGKARTSKHAVD